MTDNLQTVSTNLEPVTAERGERPRRSSKLLVVLIVVALVVVALTLSFLGHVAWLNLGASEGDVPPVSSLSILPGSDVASEEIVCRSGGCSAIYEVRPPEGRLVDELGEQLGETSVVGTFS